MKLLEKYHANLKYKIFFSLVVFILIPYVSLNLYFYSTAESIIKEKIISAMDIAIRQTSLNIEELVNRTVIGSNTLADQNEILEFMSAVDLENNFQKRSKLRVSLYELSQNVQSNILSIGTEVIIIGYNGNVYSPSALVRDAYDLYSQSEWFERAGQRRYFYTWLQLKGRDLGKVNSPNTDYMVLCRVVQDSRNRDCGMILTLFPRSKIYDLMDSLTSSAAESFFIATNGGDIILTSHNLNFGDTLHKKYAVILEKDKGYFMLDEGMGEYLLNFQGVPMLNWKIVIQSPYDSIFAEINSMRSTVIWINIAILALFGTLIFWLFNRFLRPVNSMVNLIHTVEKGDLTKRMEITTRDELGMLGRHLNDMLTNLSLLLEENYEKQQELALKEKEKETMRYLVLQSQINPHFLFNTLNNIKWLAQINKDKQVADSISSLGHLLEGTIRNMADEIPLSEEISYLKDYFEIMELSRPGKIQVVYNLDPLALQCLTPKLILQPLVENAILHGLDLIDGVGTLQITAHTSDHHLIIEVIDDGIGFDPQKAEKLLSKKTSSNRLGVTNTNQRIKLNYGENYGLKVLPVQPHGTRVIVTLPANLPKEGSNPDV